MVDRRGGRVDLDRHGFSSLDVAGVVDTPETDRMYAVGGDVTLVPGGWATPSTVEYVAATPERTSVGVNVTVTLLLLQPLTPDEVVSGGGGRSERGTRGGRGVAGPISGDHSGRDSRSLAREHRVKRAVGDP